MNAHIQTIREKKQMKMKNRIVIGFVLATLLVAIVAFSGCIEEDVEEETPNVEVIVISGIDKVTEINNDKPIKLVLSGVGNTVTISYNTIVTEIVLSGVDNIVYIPRSSTPKITDSGVNNEIIRY
jgi:hypothetical protein